MSNAGTSSNTSQRPQKFPDSSVKIRYENEDEFFAKLANVDRTPTRTVRTRGLDTNATPQLSSAVRLIETVPLASNRYFQSSAPYVKKQIYLHHTAGWGDPVGVIGGWNASSSKIGTWALIAGRKIHRSHAHTDGDVYRAFSSKHWAWHLGVSTANRDALNSESIGIELCSFGPLRKLSNGQFAPLDTNVSARFDASQVTVYDASTGHPNGYRGHHYYEKYTDAQIESLKWVLAYLCDAYCIPKEYYGMEIFDVNQRALDQEPGIWTHTSVRGKNSRGHYEKYDCHPQPELIEMLKSLETILT